MALKKTTQPKVSASNSRERERDLPGLLAALEDESADTRRWAARDLVAFAESEPALLSALNLESNSAVRNAILTTLTEIGSSAAVQGLTQLLASDDASLRNEAIEAMKELPDTVAPVMANLLADDSPDVRIFAVNVLESLMHPDVERWLIEVIKQDDHVNVCATAVDLLGEVGTGAAVEPLEALKRRFEDEPYIAFAADLALQRIYAD